MAEWYLPREAGKVEPYPWLHESAVKFFESILTPKLSVLEHGAGGSTLWLAERVEYVLTIEHNEKWVEKILAVAPANVAVTDSLPSKTPDWWDIFFIDGERNERGKCLKLAHKYVKVGGWVVLDNANRPEYSEERSGLLQHFTLVQRFANNVGASKYFVTEFWQRDK